MMKTTQLQSTASSVFCQLKVSQLVCTQTYQQGRFYPSTVRGIVEDFNPHKLKTIQVSHRDGKYFVIDGKHRVTAIKELFGADALVNCEVFEGMTYEDEARYVAEQYDNTKRVTPDQRLHMLSEAKDDDSKFIVNTLKHNNLFVVKPVVSNRDNYISCAGKLRSVYDSMSKDEFEEFIKILYSTWGGVKRSLDSRIIGGLGKFYNTYKREFDRKRFVKVLGDASPDRIIRDGNAAIASDRDSKYALVILNIYNNKLQANRLQYRF